MKEPYRFARSELRICVVHSVQSRTSCGGACGFGCEWARYFLIWRDSEIYILFSFGISPCEGADKNSHAAAGTSR
jgi:hypothetical protein